MARDVLEVLDGGVLRDAHGRRELTLRELHEAPAATDLPSAGTYTDADGREQVVLLGPDGRSISSRVDSVESGLAVGLGSVLDEQFGVVAATKILGVAVTDGGTAITQGPAPAVPFTAAMTGQRFWLGKGGPLLVDVDGSTIDGQTMAWEASPLFGTFTYVSSTQGTLSVAAETAVTDGEIIIGADQTVALNAAIAAGYGRIPRDTDIICDNVVIPTLTSSDTLGRLEGEDQYTSRLVSTVQGGNVVVSVGVEPAARNFTILGSGYGAQPTNVTPTVGDVDDFIAKLDGSGCGITFGHVFFGRIENVHARHCGGDQVTTDRNGISGIYLTMGCRYTTVKESTATYCRIGMCEDNYFGVDDDATLGGPKFNVWRGNVTNYNRIGWGCDSGANSRGCRIIDHTADWNVIYGIEVNRSRHVTGRGNSTSYNGRGSTGAPGLAIHGSSSSVTCEFVRFTEHHSYANGTHGAKISEWAKRCEVGGNFEWNKLMGVFFDNGCEDCTLLLGSIVRNNAQDGAAATESKVNVRIRDCADTYISAGVQLRDTQGSPSVTYGIYEDGTSTGTIIADDVVIDGYTTHPVKLTSATSRAGTHAKRRRLLLAAQGIKGETLPRAEAQGAFAPAAGDQRASLVGLLAGEVITNLYAHVTAAGVGVTLAKLGIWDSTGTLLASTADIDTEFTSGTGVKGGALSTPLVVPSDGGYYIGLVSVGGTSATILRASSGITGYSAQAAPGGVPPSVANTGKTDIGTLTVTASGTAPWFGWS